MRCAVRLLGTRQRRLLVAILLMQMVFLVSVIRYSSLRTTVLSTAPEANFTVVELFASAVGTVQYSDVGQFVTGVDIMTPVTTTREHDHADNVPTDEPNRSLPDNDTTINEDVCDSDLPTGRVDEIENTTRHLSPCRCHPERLREYWAM